MRPKSGSQHPHEGLHLSIIPVPEDPILSSGLLYKQINSTHEGSLELSPLDQFGGLEFEHMNFTGAQHQTEHTHPLRCFNPILPHVISELP